ncbi:MAG: BON domain-containing protein, partial [Candidatus Acidiferrales bacterium]
MNRRLLQPIVVLGLLLVAGCAKAPNDAAIVTNIKSQMFSDAQLKNATLQVTSEKGVVTVSGDVPSDAARLDAYKIATQTPGVTKVNDQMSVDSSTAQTPSEVAAATPPPAEPAREAAPKPERARKHRKPQPPAAAPVESAQVAPQDTPEPPPAAQSDTPAQPAAAVAAAQPASPPPPPPVPQPTQVVVPANTTMSIRMIDGVDSSVNQPGEIFHASLDAPIVVGDGVVVPQGADVYVRLVSASSAGRMTGKSELHLELVKLEFQGRSYPLVSSTYDLSGSSRGKNTTKKVAGGAILGTLLGAIADGGKGAAIGAAAGAG